MAAGPAAPTSHIFYDAVRGNPFGTLAKFGINSGDLVAAEPASAQGEDVPDEPRLRGQLYEAFSRLAEQRQRICSRILLALIEQMKTQAILQQHQPPQTVFHPAALSLSMVLPLLASAASTNEDTKTAVLRQLDAYFAGLAPASIPSGALAGLENLVSLVLEWRSKQLDSLVASFLLHLALALGSPGLGATALGLIHAKQLRVGLSPVALENLTAFVRCSSIVDLALITPSGTVASIESAFPGEEADNREQPLLNHPAHEHQLRLEPRPSSSWACDVCGFRASRVLGGQKRYRCAAGCNYDICLRCMSSVAADVPPSLAVHGNFVYCTSRSGSGLARVATGANGIAPGLHPLKKDDRVVRGWVASAAGCLFYRPETAAADELCYLLSSLGTVMSTIRLSESSSESSADKSPAPGPGTDRTQQEDNTAPTTLAFFGQGDTLYHVVMESVKPGNARVVRVNIFTVHLGITTRSLVIPPGGPDFQLVSTSLRGQPFAFEVAASKNSALALGEVILQVNKQDGSTAANADDALAEIKSHPAQSVSFGILAPAVSPSTSVVLKRTTPFTLPPSEIPTSVGLPISTLRSALFLAVRDKVLLMPQHSSSPLGAYYSSALLGGPAGGPAADQDAPSSALIFSLQSGIELPATLASMNKVTACTHDAANNRFYTIVGHDIFQYRLPSSNTDTVSAYLLTTVDLAEGSLLFASPLFTDPFQASHEVTVRALTEMLRSVPTSALENVLQLTTAVLDLASLETTPAAASARLKTAPAFLELATQLTSLASALDQPFSICSLAAVAFGKCVPLAYPHKADLFAFVTQTVSRESSTCNSLVLNSLLASLAAAKLFQRGDAATLLNMVPLWSSLLDLVNREILAAVSNYPLVTPTAQTSSATQLLAQMFEQIFVDLSAAEAIPFLVTALNAVSDLSEALATQLGKLSDKDALTLRTPLSDLMDRSFLTMVVLPWISVVRSQALAAGTTPAMLLPTTRLATILGRLFRLTAAMRLGGTDRRHVSIPRISSPSRKLETLHPVHDNYHFLETCTLPGAKQLYLTFDPRCSSQYDYDRVMVYAGTSTAAKKIAEYGGNTAGFGSRSVYGQGWPRRPVRIPGDSVTLEFQMRSSRESATPDHAMWGVAVVVRDEMDSHSAMEAFPSVFDLAFSLLHLILEPVPAPIRPAASLASLPLLDAYFTEHISPEFLATVSLETLLKRTDLDAPVPKPTITPRTLMLRPTIQRALDVPRLEAEIAAGAIAVLGYPADILSQPPVPTSTPTPTSAPQAGFFEIAQLSPVVSNKLTRGFERLVRWLASIADLEKRWNDEATEIAAGKSMDTHFFSTWHVDAIHAHDLRILCALMGVSLSPGHELEAVSDLTTSLRQFARDEAASALAATSAHAGDASAGNAPATSSTASGEASAAPASAAPASAAPAATSGLDAPSASADTASASVPGAASESSQMSLVASEVTTSAPRVELKLDLRITHGMRDAVMQLARLFRAVRTSRVPVFDDDACTLLDQFFTVLTDGLLGNPLLAANLVSLLQSRLAFFDHAESALQSALNCLQLMHTSGVCAPLALFVVELAVKLLCIDLQPLPKSRQASFLPVYGACFTALVKIVEADPEALLCGVAVAFSPFVSAQAVCLWESGLVSFLEKLCRSHTSSVRGSAWRAFRALALRCANWDTGVAAPAALDSMRKLSVQLGQVLEQRLSSAVQLCCGPRTSVEHYATVAESLSLFDALSESVLGMSVVTNPKSVENFMRLLMQDSCPPKILTPLVKLLARALPLMDGHIAPEHASVFQETTKPVLIGMLMHKLASLLVPRSQYSRLPSVLVAGSGVPFAQAFHAHNLMLCHSSYSSGWSCNVCNKDHSGRSFHCARCEFDLCLDCFQNVVMGKSHSHSSAPLSRVASVAAQASTKPLSVSADTSGLAPTLEESGQPLAGQLLSETADACAQPEGEAQEEEDDSDLYVVRLVRREGESVGEVLKPLLSVLQSIDDCEVEGDADGSNLLSRVDYELNKQSTSIVFRGSRLECEDFVDDCARCGAVTSMDREEEQPASTDDSKAKPVFKSPEDSVCRTWNEKLVAERSPEYFFLKASVASQMATRLVEMLQTLLQRGPVGWAMALEAHLSSLLSEVPAALASISAATPVNASPTALKSTLSHLTTPSSTLCLGLAALAVLHHRESVHLGQQVFVHPASASVPLEAHSEATGTSALTPSAGRVVAWHVPLGQLSVALDGVGLVTQYPLASVHSAASNNAIKVPPLSLLPGLLGCLEAALKYLATVSSEPDHDHGHDDGEDHDEDHGEDDDEDHDGADVDQVEGPDGVETNATVTPTPSGTADKSSQPEEPEGAHTAKEPTAATSAAVLPVGVIEPSTVVDAACLASQLSRQVLSVAAALMPELDPVTHGDVFRKCLIGMEELVGSSEALSCSASVYESELLNAHRQLLDQPCPSQPPQTDATAAATSLVLDPRHGNVSLRGVLFGEECTSVTYFSSKASRDQNLGAVVYSKDSLPASANTYFEITLERLGGVGVDGDAPLFFHVSHPHALRLVEQATTPFDCEARKQSVLTSGCGKSSCLEARRYVCTRGCPVTFCTDCVASSMAGDRNAVFGFGPKPDARKEFVWPARTCLFTHSNMTVQGSDSATIRLAAPLLALPGQTVGVFWAPSLRSAYLYSSGHGQCVPIGNVSGQFLLLNLRFPGTTFSVNSGATPFVYGKAVPTFLTSIKAALESQPQQECTVSPSVDSQSILSAFDEMPFAGDFDGTEAAASIQTPLRPSNARTESAHRDKDEADCENDDDYEDDSAVYLVDSLPAKCETPFAAKVEMPSGLAQMLGPSAVASQDDGDAEEDIPSKLIKAWETHVFPKIQSRFRNTAERKSGQEQIRGALLLGMHEIARLTVEGLYEDQGGVPADIHFPTIDEVKAAPKIVVAHLQRGTIVRITVPVGRDGFAVGAMEGTRGMVGSVLSVETAKSLALVFVYLEDEGCFRQWWFPISVLEKIGAAAALYSPATERIGVLRSRFVASERACSRALCARLYVALRQRLAEPKNLLDLQLVSRALLRTPVHQHSALAYLQGESFFATSGHYALLLQAVRSTLFTSEVTPTIPIDELFAPLLERLAYTDLPVAAGRTSADIRGPPGSWVLLSCRHEGEQPITRCLPGPKASPFLSACLGSSSVQQLVGSFPPVAIESSAPLPTLLAPSNRVSLKTIGRENSPNASVLVHAISTDFALVFALIDCVLEPASSEEQAKRQAAAARAAAVAILRALTEGHLALAMRESFLHSLAALIRRYPAELSEHFMELSSLADLEQSNVRECFKSLTLALPSSYAQAVLEVLVACLDAKLALPLLYMHEDTGDEVHGTLVALYSVVASLRSISIKSVLHQPLLDADRTPATTPSATAEAPALPSQSAASATEGSALLVQQGLSSAFEALMRAAVLESVFVLSLASEPANSEAVVDALLSILIKFGGVRQEIRVFRPGSDAAAGAAITKTSFVVHLNSAVRRAEALNAIASTALLSTASVSTADKLTASTDNVGDASHVAAFSLFLTSVLNDRARLGPVLLEILLPVLSTQPHVARASCLAEARAYVDLASVNRDDVLTTAGMFFGETPVPRELEALPLEALVPALVDALCKLAAEQPVAFVRALVLNGYDLSLGQTRPRSVESAKQAMDCWGSRITSLHATTEPSTEEQRKRNAFLADQQLVQLANARARTLGLHCMRLPPSELVFGEVEAAAAAYGQLVHASLGALRLRFALLQGLNEAVVKGLSVVDLHYVNRPGSTAALISETAGLLFYDAKIDWFNRVLNDTAQRVEGAQIPEVSFDPLQALSRVPGTQQSHFYKVLEQISRLDVTQLRTRMPTGGDPIFPLVVRMTGESVRGNSGSFRDLLLNLSRSFLNSESGLFMECPSAGLGFNQGRMTINPAPLTATRETLFEFFGLLLGIAIRADVPLPLDLLPHFWKAVTGDAVTLDDLPACDRATAKMLEALSGMSTAEQLQEYMSARELSQMVHTMDGRTVNLLPHLPLLTRSISAPFTPGGVTSVPLPGIPFADLPEFVRNLRELRLRELQSRDAVEAIRRGLSAIVPLDALTVMSWQDLELRVCGLPDIDLAFLREHTHYQVGLSETDQHIRYFWRVLESLQPDELRMFVKFASNLERLPTTCTCKKAGSDAHVPPYPMKLAPPDGSGPADKRFIRAETCMFMIKLPQYSTLELMRERLLHAIHCRDDPLSG